MNNTSYRVAAATILAFACPPLFAHPGHGGALMDGLLHPYAGIDHLLGALTIGLWAARQGRSLLYTLPAAFLFSLACGIVLGAAVYSPAWLDQGIAISLMAAGLLACFTVRLRLFPALLFASASALLHGLAHGSDMAATANLLRFGTGMMLGTGLLLLAGAAAGTRFAGKVRLLRLAGAVATACGIALALLPA